MDGNSPTNEPQNQEVQAGSHFFSPLPPNTPGARTFSYWIKKFLACNPFYLFSAALLLYGFYLVSSDANFPGREASQLAFNLGSLQFYEALLVATAIVLARRLIWYDSVLLTGLENLLVLVPFILISQAALLNPRTVWLVCVAVGVAALLRFWCLKHFFRELNLPRRLLICGFLLLLVNVALPLIYRHLNESKIGTKPVEGAAYEMDRYSWLVLLPALFALVNVLPRLEKSGNPLPRHPWLPFGWFVLWLAGSAVHLFCLSYVYNFDWEFLFAVPSLWVVLWSIQGRHSDFLPRPMPRLSNCLLLPPVAVTFLAMTDAGCPVFLVLTALNIVAYTVLFLKDRSHRMAFHLLLISLAALPAGLLIKLQPGAPARFSADQWVIVAVACYFLYWVLRSRRPEFGLLGSWIMASATLLLVKNMEIAPHLAAQLALAFLLLHSLRWNGRANRTAGQLRWVAGTAWVLHAFFLVHTGWGHAIPLAYGAGGFVLAISVWRRFSQGSWKPVAVPIAALLVLLAQPGDFLGGRLQSAPGGLLALTGSFLLFGLGTLAALTKSKWNAPPAAAIAATETHQTD